MERPDNYCQYKIEQAPKEESALLSNSRISVADLLIVASAVWKFKDPARKGIGHDHWLFFSIAALCMTVL